MNPYEMMKLHEAEFTKSDQQIYQSILKNPQNAISFSIVRSAELMNSSKDGLLRFCKKIGYEGFKEFRFELARYVHSGIHESVPSTSSDKRKKVIEIYKQGLSDLVEGITDTNIHSLSDRILQSNHIRIFAIHRTSLAAKEFSYRLMKIGIASDSYHDSLFFKSIIDTAKAGDLHIFITMSANSPDILESIENSKKANAKIILVTQNDRYKNDQIDQIIILPSLAFSHDEFFLDSTMLAYAYIECLIMEISARMITHIV